MASKAKHIKAAEAALGLEPIGTETQAEAELRRKWERHFAPLGLALRDEYPPEDMWFRVQASLDRADDRRTIAQTRRGIWRWRFATFGATALAAGLAAFVVMKDLQVAPQPAESGASAQYVAVVTPEGSKDALIVELDLEAGTARVRPIGVAFQTERDLQMWRIAPESAPVPVGLLQRDGSTSLPLTADPGDTIAISLEPLGGSTTGAPTGPVVYSGALIAVPE
jgi:anti-sigma-K factor RskA